MNPLILASFFATPAAGADLSVGITVTGGNVLGTISLHATPEQVRTVLSDPIATAGLSPDVVSAEAAASGDCYELHVRVRGLLSPMSFRSRRCPTSDGWDEVLLSSEDFTSLHQRWALVPTPGGTRVELSTSFELSFPVPQSLVLANTRRSVGVSLQHLAARLGEEG